MYRKVKMSAIAGYPFYSTWGPAGTAAQHSGAGTAAAAVRGRRSAGRGTASAPLARDSCSAPAAESGELEELGPWTRTSPPGA